MSKISNNVGNPLCIYHKHCFDGAASAWVVWDYFDGEVEMVAMGYEDSIIDLDIVDRNIYIVDFSFPKPLLEAMCVGAAWVTVIDHHKSARENCIYDDSAKMPTNLTLFFDMEQSGCGLTWRYFHGRNLAPQLLLHIQDRDLWRFDMPGTKAIGAALGLYDYSMETYASLFDMDTEALAQIGEVLLRKQAREVDQLLSEAIVWRTVAGYDVPTVNCPPWLASEVGNVLMETRHCPFSVMYHDVNGNRKFSMRSSARGIDVANLAKGFGGGGHRNAAGFTTSEAFQFPLALNH